MKAFVIQNRQATIQIQLSAIYYIQSHPTKAHHLEVVTKEGAYDMVGTLAAIEKKHSDEFVRCHRNCLVNLSQIREIRRTEKVLVLGEQGQHQVALSRRRYRIVLQKYLEERGE